MADYPPRINIQFLKTNNKRISGVGEEAIPQIAPALAQAVFQVTGKRIRSLPLKNHDLRKAKPSHKADAADQHSLKRYCYGCVL